jgi:hypothetical protein
MALFDDVFNKTKIFEMFFFNIKAVLIYPTLEEFKLKNSKMYERWKYISKTKYNCDMSVFHGAAGTLRDETPEYGQRIYENNAIHYPEFSKIIAITYATMYTENGVPKRDIKKIINEDEGIVVDEFMNVLNVLSGGDIKLQSILCGHNIVAYDIPLLIKRFLFLKDNIKTKELPFILKRVLNIKPWESGIIDTINVWKFNGFEYSPLMLISDYLSLKKTVDLLPLDELSKYYWTNVGTKPKETLDFVGLQSATQTNLVIQLMVNELRLI